MTSQDQPRHAAPLHGGKPRKVGTSVTARAAGKINVSFAVGPLRADGYHSVLSVYLAVGLYEDVKATITAEPGISVSVIRGAGGFDSVDGSSRMLEPLSAVPTNADNLAVKAALLMADVSENPTGLHLEITKRVPVAGGMGGGSADAAATLVACDALWNAGLSRQELAHIGSELGADVPFAISGGAAVGMGVGDELSPILAPRPMNWVLVRSDFGLSTPTVYATLDRLRAAGGAKVAAVGEVNADLISALRGDDATALVPFLRNDLQAAALSLAPGLADVLRRGSELGALGGLVSGSGPTLAYLSVDETSAEELARALRANGFSALTVQSPGGPAKIISEYHPEVR